MERAGAKRVLGIALIASAGVMLVLATLFWTGVIDLAPGARPVLCAALVLAALVDLGVGVKFMQSPDPE
jgi:hypothetical protein